MDHDAEFTAFMRARWPAFARTLVLLGCGLSEAEDIAQSAMLACYTAWPRVRGAADPDAYAHRVLLNTWQKSRRRKWRGETPTEALPETLSSEPEPAGRVALTRALGRLSEKHRTVLVLRFVADLSERQVAATLGIPVGTVKSRVARAIAAVNLDDLTEETR